MVEWTVVGSAVARACPFSGGDDDNRTTQAGRRQSASSNAFEGQIFIKKIH
jgi:hypothetical protein